MNNFFLGHATDDKISCRKMSPNSKNKKIQSLECERRLIFLAVTNEILIVSAFSRPLPPKKNSNQVRDMLTQTY